jgi:V/A-type H+-transporting ATPase subunit D
MAKLNVAPTKSNYLTLSRQLDFAQEGFDLLEQKRQILIFELMSRLGRARDAERRVTRGMEEAYRPLRETLLDVGSQAVDRAGAGVRLDHEIELADQSLMGIRLPTVKVSTEAAGVQFGVVGTTAQTDVTMKRFIDMLPMLAELAELENAVLRLARELRKTQRRCNALSKVFIPDYSETIDYITQSLEEREREAVIIMKMIKERLTGELEGSARHG